jgi:hypothetical protein
MHVVEGQSRERPGEVERDTAGGGRVCRTHERKEKKTRGCTYHRRERGDFFGSVKRASHTVRA